MRSRVPVLVVSGFLGSGKTTLVRRLLEDAQARGERVAIVSNEFGALGIDEALLGGGEERFVELAPKSTVLSQSPPPGSTEPRGSEITLDVSAGQRQLQVPPVVGLTQALAQDAIEKAGLDVGDVRETESQTARGAVLETSPAAGTVVTPSTRVDLVVSSGPPAVNAPDVVGQSYPTARSMLEQVGLLVGDVTIDSLAIGIPNSVVAQTPAAGARVTPGSRISLRIVP